MGQDFSISEEMYNWAIERAKTDDETLQNRFPKLNEWKTGKKNLA